MRQLGRPALLAATYSGDGPGAAAAAMVEVEGVLVSSLHELERGSAGPAGAVSTQHDGPCVHHCVRSPQFVVHRLRICGSVHACAASVDAHLDEPEVSMAVLHALNDPNRFTTYDARRRMAWACIAALREPQPESRTTLRHILIENGSRADKDGGARPDWAHVYLAVLPLLPLNAAKDEAKIAVALRHA